MNYFFIIIIFLIMVFSMNLNAHAAIKSYISDIPNFNAIALTVSALESNYWERVPPNSYNPFGIKYISSRHKSGTRQKTKEFINGVENTVYEGFAIFDNWYEAARDFEYILKLPRYKKVIDETDIYLQFSNLHAAGYATDPEYPNKLKGVYLSLKQKNLI